MTMMMIHCPSCGAQLNVPEGAAGRLGRCPACEGEIRIPGHEEVLEESVTSWLAEDAEDEDEGGGPSPAAEGRGSAAPAPRKNAPVETSGSGGGPSGERPGGGDGAGAAERAKGDGGGGSVRSAASPPVSGGKGEGAAESAEGPRAAAASQSPPAQRARPDEPQRPGAAPRRPERGESSARSSASGKRVYEVRSAVKPVRQQDDDLVTYKASGQPRPAAAPRPAADRPRPTSQEAAPAGDGGVVLMVQDVAPTGVRIAFDARLLNRLAFRASMPFHCMGCGQKEPERLIARPLSWISRGTGKSADPLGIENSYEIEVRAHQLQREVVQSMGSINEYNAPFNQPMPYFVCGACQKHGRCTGESVASPNGVHCEVQVPSGRYALEWLGRVNGVCGDAYLELEAEVLKSEDRTWRELPEQVRHRLTAWFDFRAGERFLAYYGDSDFGKKESGLGGVVLTDQRLVYCKYHHQGSLPLHEGGELRAVEDGPFRKIIYRHEGQGKKLANLRPEDWGALCETVNGLDVALRAVGEG